MNTAEPSRPSRVLRAVRERFFVSERRAFVCALAACACAFFLFSPELRFGDARAERTFPRIGVAGEVSEEEDLRDSAPLFLPTRWNGGDENLAAELDVAQDENLSFGGIFFLDADGNRAVLEPRDLEADEKDVFAPARRWNLVRAFGQRADAEPAARADAGVKLAVFDSTRGTAVFFGTAAADGVPATEFEDPKMLLRPVEIFCYGEPTRRQFYITASSEDSKTDAAALRLVKSWAREHLRGAGEYRFRLGK
ncbi:MAG: hypothetical protein ACI4QA_01240 [Candidatus Spyradosoma sp.]